MADLKRKWDAEVQKLEAYTEAQERVREDEEFREIYETAMAEETYMRERFEAVRETVQFYERAIGFITDESLMEGYQKALDDTYRSFEVVRKQYREVQENVSNVKFELFMAAQKRLEKDAERLGSDRARLDEERGELQGDLDAKNEELLDLADGAAKTALEGQIKELKKQIARKDKQIRQSDEAIADFTRQVEEAEEFRRREQEAERERAEEKEREAEIQERMAKQRAAEEKMRAYEEEGKKQYDEYIRLQNSLADAKTQEEYEGINKRMAEIKADYESKEGERKAAMELIDKIKEDNKKAEERIEKENVAKALQHE